MPSHRHCNPQVSNWKGHPLAKRVALGNRLTDTEAMLLRQIATKDVVSSNDKACFKRILPFGGGLGAALPPPKTLFCPVLRALRARSTAQTVKQKPQVLRHA